MQAMTTVSLVGLIAGSALILTAIVVFVLKREFPAGGVAVTMVGLVLIGMSQWSSIKISAGGATLDLQVRQTAAAAAAVAEQAERAAVAAETTRQQVAVLARQLESRNVLTTASVRSIQTSLEASPRVDLSRLQSARADLNRITRR